MTPLPFPTGRLAPSPTGKLHLGHARTFLLAWWSVRSRGGRVVLRMEDLDAPRVVPGASEQILRDLEWLGLDWDGSVIVQSSRLGEIEEAATSLAERGLAYPCVCTRGDVRSAQSAPHAGDVEPRYPGSCRGKFATLEEAERVSGKPAGLRFLVPDEDVTWTDGFVGPMTTNVQTEVGDFLIARRGGLPAYQLAVVVDDARDGVTEVVRGDDLLSSTGRQLLLQRALGFPHPEYVHVPLVVDRVGRRLAKRADDLSLTELRARGIDPRSVVAWAARTAGIPGETRSTAVEVAARFSLDRVPRHVVDGADAVKEFSRSP